MLTAHKISKSYNIHTILKEVTFSVNTGERVGLIGANGTGKTTLLHILTGQEKPDSGSVTLSPPDLPVGYLAQGFEPDPELTIAQVLNQTVGDPEALEAELARLATALAQQPEREDLQLAYDHTLHRLSRCDIGRIQGTLTTFGLDDIDDSQTVGNLSGGQKTRLALALLIMGDPQLLLLDEPTNHLDIEMLEWLEAWLADFTGGVLIVSHDRTFLDHTTNRILDLDAETHTLREYSGNYSDYLEQYLKEQEKKMAAYKEQVYEIRRMKQDIVRTKEQSKWVERTTTPRQPNIRRYAKKVAKKAKAREKKLARFQNSDERVEKPKQGWQMKVAFNEEMHLGRDVLTLEDLSVGYEGHPPLLRHLNHHIGAGRRVVLTGPNGSGKTTLLRTIAGRLPPLSGKARLGSSVHMGYMAQEQELLDPELTPLETIQRLAPMNQTEARSFLHFFLFAGDEPLRPNHKLSYGERARLSLAKLIAKGCNFLVLDEPINHLDIPSRTRFEQALAQFEGAVLAVVHDRYFIDRFATDLWVVEGQQVRAEIRRRD